MSDENTASNITEALERAAQLHADATRELEELLRDEDVVEIIEDSAPRASAQ